ncbi:MAG: adenine nucleotide alpha hydrolase [Proteobacteria bacterium]|nr:adenine nucleotide alpha hydrolase [Pseudomonadota bacterium]
MSTTGFSRLSALQAWFEAREPMAIAVSGGVDSMTLAVVAHRIQPETQVFHALSPAVPSQATERVREYAAREGWNLTLIDAGEMQDENYLANPANRCYFCKTNLYETVTAHTPLRVGSGTNTDDLADYRPGLQAAAENQVCHPYVEVGISKAELREIAAEMGLDDLKDLPASPCLSSRVQTGIAIDATLLPLVNEAEQLVMRHLSRVMSDVQGVRCRILPGEVTLQVDTPSALDMDDPRFAQPLELIRRLFVEAGYASQVARVRVEPYRRGSAFLIETLEVS